MLLDEGPIQKCREAFATFDISNNGSIEVSCIQELLQSIGQAPSAEMLQQFIAVADPDETGKADFASFMRAVCTKSTADPLSILEEDVLLAFRAFGGCSDSTGYASVAEIQSFTEKLGLDYHTFLRLPGTSGSTQLEFSEFAKLFAL